MFLLYLDCIFRLVSQFYILFVVKINIFLWYYLFHENVDILWAYMYIAHKDFSFKTIYIVAEWQVSIQLLSIHPFVANFNIFDFFRTTVFSVTKRKKNAMKVPFGILKKCINWEWFKIQDGLWLAETFCWHFTVLNCKNMLVCNH